MRDNKTISVLVDSDSWILPYAKKLVDEFVKNKYSANLVRSANDVKPGWLNFMLGCLKIVNTEILDLNEHNLVVHESALPNGKGFAPMSWQILEGKRDIDICLIEATDDVDSGDIWLQDNIELTGTELLNDWRRLQGLKSIELCMNFVEDYDNLTPRKQIGSDTYYSRRQSIDSELDVNESILDQFNLLRIVDNENYPAFFCINGDTYFVKIYKNA